MRHALSPHAALIVVDVQPDFMPGGTLACHEGDAIVPGIDQLLRSRAFRHVGATQDWHPRGHAWFASSHPGTAPFEQIEMHGQPQTLWPEHCVQGTAGAELHPGHRLVGAGCADPQGQRSGCGFLQRLPREP